MLSDLTSIKIKQLIQKSDFLGSFDLTKKKIDKNITKFIVKYKRLKLSKVRLYHYTHYFACFTKLYEKTFKTIQNI